jgi:hypothetical protein
LNIEGYTSAALQINGVQVIGPQQAAIAAANGTLADITTKFNTLLTELAAHGLIA